MLPHRVLILAVLLLVWCVAIVTTTWAAIVGGLANPDVAAYLNGIQLWQRGARLYEDFLEVYPPAVFFVYLPGVWLSKLAGVPLREGLYAWVSVLALCSSCTVGVLLGRAGGRFAPFEVALVAASTVYVLFRMVGVDSPAEMSPAERETSRRMLSDLARRPHALVFDQRVGRERFGRSGFKWLDYVKSFPEAAAVLREYRPVLRGGAYELWVRSDVPDRGPDPSTTGPAHQAGVSPLEGDAG